MKILMLTPYLPYPLYSGGQIRTYNLLKNLAQHHEITLFSFIRHEEENEHISELLKFCKEVKTFKRRSAWSLINVFLAGLTPYPFLVSIYLSLTLRHAIKEELSKNHYDLIHSETFYVMPNIPQTSVPVLLVEQTIEFLVYEHFVKQVILPLRLLLRFDVLKIKAWETYFWKKAQRVVAMSEADSLVMQKTISNLEVAIIPNGVDIKLFSQKKRKKTKTPRILFVGNFKWLQNKEAVLILIRDIWPRIRKKNKDIELWIVGRYPPDEIKTSSGRDNIIIDDSVGDISTAYAVSSVLLAPIYGPGGTRYKILEAMASGLPVVTTTKGIEGLGAVDEKEVVIRESPKSLADATLAVIEKKSLAEKLAFNSKAFIQRNYQWEDIAKKLDQLYREVGRG